MFDTNNKHTNKTLSLSVISMLPKEVRVLTGLGDEYITNKNKMNVSHFMKQILREESVHTHIWGNKYTTKSMNE